MDHRAPARPQAHARKQFVLCFDGTGNKFSGTDADSNILKIYRMLDREGNDQFHYYQPGIGTYVTKANGSMTRTSRIDRFKSWYAKAKDSAIGTSFDQHVMAGYKFLMRYYTPGDDIFFFGFSRGAYTARFLAEMLDSVGLLSAGNEEMCQFAWKTFQKWQCRSEGDKGDKKEKRQHLEFMCAFRETFSRPVRPIRFLGLFDTVNSVPHFESAWMRRTKFPYTARSSAKVIRHAVSIDERRAKFRQDLLSQEKPEKSMLYKHRRRHRHIKEAFHDGRIDEQNEKTEEEEGGRRDTLAPPEQFRSTHKASDACSLSPSCPSNRCGSGRNSAATSIMSDQIHSHNMSNDDDDDDDAEQDIREVWFPGCHADIGGGWPLDDGQDAALSHVPLAWMVYEAQKAGLQFDEDKLEALHCWEEDLTALESDQQADIPEIEIDPASPTPSADGNGQSNTNPDINKTVRPANGTKFDFVDETHVPDHHVNHPNTKFHRYLHYAMTKGRMHDVLQFNNGVGAVSVVGWNLMEYMPFRRMDLREDGSWKAITWPLPKGETRDIPDEAIVHCSVIKRMIADEKYRPGNLIVGGGGRGVRTAPKEMGIGKWVVACEEGNMVGECFMRKEKPVRVNTKDKAALKALMDGQKEK